MNYFGIVSLFNGLFAFFTGLYVFLKDRKNPLYVSFSFFAASVALWAIFYALWQSQNSKAPALFFMRLAMIPCYAIPSAFLWFVLTLIEREGRKKYLPVCFGIPVLFLGFSFSRFAVKDVTARLFFPYWPAPGLLMHAFVFLFFAVLAYAFYLLFQAWSRSYGIRRWQLKWITVTTLVAFLGGSTNWFLWYNIPVPPIPNFFVAVFFLLIAYGVMRRQLFDIDTLADIIQEAKLSTLGIFAAGLLHQIRSPLCVAKGYAQSLLGDAGGEGSKAREKLEKIIRQINRVSDIAERFLDLAKPHGGARKLEIIPLSETIEGVLSFISHESRLGEIKVEKELRPDSTLYADRRDLEEILLNLLTNACQAMSKKGGVLKIADEPIGGRLRIHISDTGEGIPSDHLKRLFEPFFTTKKDKGTGLGLYIVKKLVERNGGKIKVASEMGRGTAFTLEFPVASENTP